MSYIIYEIESTLILGDHRQSFKSEAAAKAALTRAVKKGGIDRSLYAIAESGEFYEHIEKMVERENFMNGKKFMERANTPYYCSASSETFWSA